VLARGDAERSRAQVLRLVRALLLPNDHVVALLLQWLFAAVFIAIFTLSANRGGRVNLSAVGFYMVMARLMISTRIDVDEPAGHKILASLQSVRR